MSQELKIEFHPSIINQMGGSMPPNIKARNIAREEFLGGLLKSYYRTAA
jgi:hypothetical protein